MQTIKTYPPVVERIREYLLADIERVGMTYGANPDVMTASKISAYAPMSPAQAIEAVRSYHRAIARHLQLLVDLERYATIRLVFDRNEASELGIDLDSIPVEPVVTR